jgi:hypothetical protein
LPRPVFCLALILLAALQPVPRCLVVRPVAPRSACTSYGLFKIAVAVRARSLYNSRPVTGYKFLFLR